MQKPAVRLHIQPGAVDASTVPANIHVGYGIRSFKAFGLASECFTLGRAGLVGSGGGRKQFLNSAKFWEFCLSALYAFK